MLLILQNLDTKKNYEVSWIFNRGVNGYYLLVENARGEISIGSQVILAKYSPKLEKKIVTKVMKVENNSINKNICVFLKNKKEMAFFKQALIEKV